MRFDMRAPSFGAPAAALYSAAADMCAWAETRGCIAAVLCEHHGSDDGYLPSPIVLASAIAARTQRLPLNITVILPFYDPVRLAEDLSLLDIARTVSITPRALQYAFRRHLDTTPTSYLRKVRLDRAHTDLLNADPTRGDTVGSIAMRWGFLHLGNFAASYRDAYGTTPRQTLRS